MEKVLEEMSILKGYSNHLPRIFYFLTATGFNMISDGLRDFLDPKTRFQVS
jgi:ABC-type dipeptide/oligopeptide/nickel transport system permease subunit